MDTMERRRTCPTSCKLGVFKVRRRAWALVDGGVFHGMCACVWCNPAGLLWKPTPPSRSYLPLMWTLVSCWWWSWSGKRTLSSAGPGGMRTLSTFVRCASNLAKHSPGNWNRNNCGGMYLIFIILLYVFKKQCVLNKSYKINEKCGL